MFCPVTGETPCKCAEKRSVTTIGSALKVDLKSALHKVFTDHVVYTNLVIMESVPTLEHDTPALVKRLLQNPEDMKKLFEPILGTPLANSIKDAFHQHLVLANDALQYVRNKDAAGTSVAVEKFYTQGDTQLSPVLVQINPQQLPYSTVQQMIHQHNEYVVKLATLREQGSYQEFVDIYDAYYKHMLMLADAVYRALD